MTYGNEGINGRFGLSEDDAAERKARRAPWVFMGWVAVFWLVRLVAFSALMVLLFLQGPEWVREGGFCARAAAAIGLAIGWECAWGLLLPSARRSPDDGRSGSSSFSHSIDKLLGGVIAAISWEIVLNLSVRGVVASTFGIVAAFAGAELLLTAASFVIITALVFALA